MNNKKGFTLVELLGVIVIIGVLALIAVPTVLTTIKQSKQDAYNQQVNTIKMALQNWKVSNPSFTPKDGETIYLSVGQLKSENYLDDKLVNPLTDKAWPNDMKLTVSNNNGIIYDVLENSGTVLDQYTKKTPSIKLSTPDVIVLNVGDIFSYPFVTTYDSNGNSEVGSIVPTIIKASDKTQLTEPFNTSTPGVYYLKYQKTIDDIPLLTYQTVIIRNN